MESGKASLWAAALTDQLSPAAEPLRLQWMQKESQQSWNPKLTAGVRRGVWCGAVVSSVWPNTEEYRILCKECWMLGVTSSQTGSQTHSSAAKLAL